MTEPPLAQPSGLPVDSSGGPTIDPTANVIALVRAEKERSDDLREWEIKYFDAVTGHLKEIACLRAEHSKELRANDIERNSNIRQVDITNASNAAGQTQTAIQTLAKTTEDIRKTLADAMANRDARTDEKIGALERSSSLGEGKQRVADPAFEKLTEVVAALAKNQTATTGRDQGFGVAWQVIVAVAGLLIAAAVYFK